MSQICHICNTECQDTEEFCHSCGARLVKAEPQAAKKSAPSAGNAVKNVSKLLKKPEGLATVVSYILVVVAVLNLIFGILFLAGAYDAHLSMAMNKKVLDDRDVEDLNKYKVSLNIPASKLYDMDELPMLGLDLDELDISYGGLQAVNIIYGICLIALAGLAVYLFLLIRKHSKQTALILMIHALATLGVVLLYMLLYKILGTKDPDIENVKLNIALPFFVWIHLLVGAGLTVYNFLAFPKAKKSFNQ